ncbi:TRAP transporter small permease [Roseospira marina]|uniref:TRAP transporter small permease protein n=1 Tax=Roseospira marina TaxID=140057 RepID=A0A5M6IHY7_9PROT|nr:TRAP transporter small permease [Roseospira marina]KAA5607577.1 TRAP transporter small permease [Roseospira marina]MBB4312231.1 TRAP-type C4-dicarboxylate transport system permease small subunit [Roseospira marina]MBB5085753.1 TRAP-type C4-dicarboxylate transport system permease small subunit [Roseospira marina]
MPARPEALTRTLVSRIDALCTAAAVLGAACLAGLFLLILSEVLARNLLGQSLAFSWDFAAYGMGCCFFLSAANTMKNSGHVRVTVLFELLPPGPARIAEGVACVLGMLVSLALVYALGDMAWLSYVRGSTAASVVKTPLWIPQSLMTLGALVFVLALVAQFLRVLLGEGHVDRPDIEDAL